MDTNLPQTPPALQQLVNAAIEMTTSRLATAPEWNVLRSIEAQLHYISSDLMAGRTPDEDVLKRINIGLYAVREFDASDPEYAELLIEIAYRYKHLGSSTLAR